MHRCWHEWQFMHWNQGILRKFQSDLFNKWRTHLVGLQSEVQERARNGSARERRKLHYQWMELMVNRDVQIVAQNCDSVGQRESRLVREFRILR